MLAKGPVHMADKLVNLIALSCTKKANNFQGAINVKCGSENKLNVATGKCNHYRKKECSMWVSSIINIYTLSNIVQ